MKGIKYIRAKNFAGYDDVEIPLSEGVNYFYGPTDSGKSTIERMIEWCLQNKPAGFHFAQKGIKGTEVVSVEIEFYDGVIVERRRNANTINEYVLNRGYENTYKALKGQLPERVAEAINLQEISIQKQEEQFFLIDLPPKQLTKKINESVDLELMDVLSGILSKRVRDTKKEKELAVLREKRLGEKIDALDWLEDADKEMQELVKIEEEDFALTKKRDNIVSYQKQLKALNLHLEEQEEILVVKPDVEALMKKEQELLQKTKEQERFNGFIGNLYELEDEIAELQELVKMKEDAEKVEAFAKELQTEGEEVAFFKKKAFEVEALNKKIADKEEEKEFLNKKYQDTLKELGVCPTCGAEVCDE